jgi:cell wall-associated NlpC family hydrolase
MVYRRDVVNLARSYVGTKYRHQGRTREGIDCAGLVILVGNELGLINYDTDGYLRKSTGRQIFQYFKDSGMEQISTSDLKLGDVILTRDSIFPCHCAIICTHDLPSSSRIVHAYAKRRQVVEEYMNAEWINKTVGAFRFKGLKD